MARGTVYIYFAGKPDDEHDRIHPESGETVEWDEGAVIVTARSGARRIYPWSSVRALFEDAAVEPYWHSLSYPEFLDLAIEATDEGQPALEGSTEFGKLGRLVTQFFAEDTAKAKADAAAAGMR